MLPALVWFALGFAFGSIPFGWLFARARGVDVRHAGSGNIGATNVARTVGWLAGLATLLADAAKGAGPVLVASHASTPQWAGPCAALGAVCGHLFTPFLKFRGGKGVATAAGTMAVLAPLPLTEAAALFSVIVWWSGYVSAGSLAAALTLPVFCWLHGTSYATTLAAAAMAGLIWVRHRDNLYRLAHGTERKITFRRS